MGGGGPSSISMVLSGWQPAGGQAPRSKLQLTSPRGRAALGARMPANPGWNKLLAGGLNGGQICGPGVGGVSLTPASRSGVSASWRSSCPPRRSESPRRRLQWPRRGQTDVLHPTLEGDTHDRIIGGPAGSAGISAGGIIVIIGIVLMFVWSFWIGLIVALIGLIAFGGFARGKWY